MGPPQGHLVAGPGESHVEVAEILAPLLVAAQLQVVGPRRVAFGPPHIEGSAVAGVRVVVHDGLAVAGGRRRAPGEGEVNHRELQALGSVNGEYLHRFGVGFEAAAALLALVAPGLLHPPGEPRPQGSRFAGTRGGFSVEELGDVTGVGEPPLAGGDLEQGGGQRPGGDDGAQEAGHPVSPEDLAPPVQLGGQLVPRLLTRFSDLRRRHADPGGERQGGGARRQGGLLQRFQQPHPVLRRRGQKDALGASLGGGHVGGGQSVADEDGLVVGADEDGDVAGAQRPPLAIWIPQGRPRRQQAHCLGGHIGCHPLLGGRLEQPFLGLRQLCLSGAHQPDAHPRPRRRPPQPRLPVGARRPDR